MPDSAKQQLLNDIEKKAINKYELNNEEFQKIKEELFSSIKREDWGEAFEKLEQLEEERGWNLEEEKQFTDQIANPGQVEKIDEGDPSTSMPKREKLLLKRQIEETDDSELLARTDKSVGTEQLFNVHEGFYRDTGNSVFVISDQQEWEGRISVELSGTREKFELMSVYENKDGELFFKHFGQNNPNKGYNKIEELTKSFYQYKFVADDKEYLALSTEKLDTVRCKVHGTKVSLNDYKTVGEFSKVAVNQDIVFVHSVEPAIEPLTDAELEEYRKGLTHDDLAESLLGGWRQPEWFEKMLIADLIVNEENGYPSHLIWLAQPGTGKSKVVESLLRSMDESQKEPFTGSGSTVKGLVPSFKESPPDEGYLLTTQRVAGVDEKMDLLSNSIKQSNESSNDVFRPLLNLLTHDVRTFESGNGSIKGQMMSTMIATGNFNAYGIGDMKELAEKIDHAYLSRAIIYKQTDTHVEYINDRKAEVKQKMQEENITEEDLFPEPDDEFISMMDTMREHKHARIDFMNVRSMHKSLMEAVPGYMREVFKQRGDHHIENIALGVAKYRYLIGESNSLEADEETYEEVRKIFELIIGGWGDVDVGALSFEARKEALTPAQRRVFNVIDDNPGIEGAQIVEKTDEDSLSWLLTELSNQGLVVVDEEEDGKPHYPYWTEEYEELTEGEEEGF